MKIFKILKFDLTWKLNHKPQNRGYNGYDFLKWFGLNSFGLNGFVVRLGSSLKIVKLFGFDTLEPNKIIVDCYLACIPEYWAYTPHKTSYYDLTLSHSIYKFSRAKEERNTLFNIVAKNLGYM